MAVQTVRSSARTGLDLTTTAVAADVAGDSWANTGAEMVAVINGAVAPITVTEVYNSSASFDGVTAANRTVSIPAGDTVVLGPFSQAYFNDANGRAAITYSAVATIKVCVFRLGA